MPVQLTPRRKNRYPQAGDAPVVHTDIQNLATDLDDAPTYDQGVIASRPTSTAPSPGEMGRWYRSTNQGPGNQGLLYLDNGTGWDNVAKFAQIADTYANRPAAGADLNGLRFWATDKWMEWQCIASAWVLLRAEAQPLAAPPTDANSVDGQRISLPLGNGRVVFRYDAAGGTYRWKCEGGGGQLEALADAGVNATIPGPTFGPTPLFVTIPWPGDWASEWGGEWGVGLSVSAGYWATWYLSVWNSAGAVIQAGETDYGANGAVPPPGGMQVGTLGYATGASFGSSFYHSRRTTKTVTVANNRIYQRYGGGNGTVLSMWSRFIYSRPIQITGN